MPVRAHAPATTPPARPTAVTHVFPRDRRSVGRAREALREQLAIWRISGEVADSAVLSLSELATNAVAANAAGCRTIGVRFELTDRTLRLEVSDGSGGRPALKHAADDDECGRGLALVDALADRWGVEPLGAVGKVVWAQLALRNGHRASAPAAKQRRTLQTGDTV